ncbi:imidazole glycerol phosphate synthase subunit HisF [Clostridia bacterium]|nr:imidazole glycerol phosphate synthase subunit HisF [Clostridia bacterium]
MLAKRIIPCLDVRNGKVVKGVNFEGIKDVGDPVALAQEYNRQGADELVFYDITASHEGRGVILDVVREVAKKVFIPLCVGGGVSTVDDFREILRAGADKVSINSQAVKNPQLIKDAADIFGSQCVVLGIDCSRVKTQNPNSQNTENEHTNSANISEQKYTVFVNGGRIDMHLDLIEWVKKATELGAGEICLNSIDTDGVRGGFDYDMLNAVCAVTNIPVIASGGLGKIDDFYDVFTKTNASAGLGASLFHFGELTISQVKEFLREKDILCRIAAANASHSQVNS